MEIKYVIINYSFPIIFPACFVHSDFQGQGGLGEITSAGFVNLVDPKNPKVYGCSQSLKLYPAEGDEYILKMLLTKDY